MHNQGLESVFSELWECERREGWLAGLKQETMPPEQDWMGKGMAILPTRAKRQKAYRLWFIPNSRSFLEIDGRIVCLFSEVSCLLNNDHIPTSDYFKPDSILILAMGNNGYTIIIAWLTILKGQSFYTLNKVNYASAIRLTRCTYL